MEGNDTKGWLKLDNLVDEVFRGFYISLLTGEDEPCPEKFKKQFNKVSSETRDQFCSNYGLLGNGSEITAEETLFEELKQTAMLKAGVTRPYYDALIGNDEMLAGAVKLQILQTLQEDFGRQETEALLNLTAILALQNRHRKNASSSLKMPYYTQSAVYVHDIERITAH